MNSLQVSQVSTLDDLEVVCLVPRVVESTLDYTASSGYTVLLTCSSGVYTLVTQKNVKRVFKSIDSAYNCLVNYVCDNNALFQVDYLKD